MKAKFFLALIALFPILASAQTSLEIESSRPGAAIGTNTVGSSFFQIESGFEHLSDKGADTVEQDTWVTELRYGLSEKLELTGEFDVESDRAPNEPNEEGISDVELGLKYSLSSEAHGLCPALGVRARLQLPGGGSSFYQKNPAPKLILASKWALSEHLDLEGDVGVRANTDEGKSDPFYALNLSSDISDNAAVFVEGFHGIEDETGNIEVDAGIGYHLNPDLQIDLAGGWGHNHGVTETLVSAGISWRAATRPASVSTR
jgi:Putative MetA-pathway of phenol degradation